MENGTTTALETTEASTSQPRTLDQDIQINDVLKYTNYTVFAGAVLILILAGLVRLFIKRRQIRKSRLRNNTVSIFDLATVFQDDRDPYCVLGTDGTRFGENFRCISGTATHSYSEVTPIALNILEAKSQEELRGAVGEKDLSGLPRKCNTLSGILWSRLGVGYKKSDHATLDRYITAQRGSATSTNDYVDRCHEDLKHIQYRPSYMSMADGRGANSFVPEDDNLWERCSSDGSIEHDVLLRQDVDPMRADGRDNRLSTMSDLLRSSWMEASMDKEYFNVSRGSELSEDRIGGVFIPESDLDHPLQDGEADINQVSQNIIDLITESFSAKIQKRESDDWDSNLNDSITKTGVDVKMSSLDNVLPEPEKVPDNSNIERTNSFSPIASTNQETRNKKLISETLPRSQKRPLPPVPRKKTTTRYKNVEGKTSYVLVPVVKSEDHTTDYMNPPSAEDKDGSKTFEEDEDAYENMADVNVRKPGPIYVQPTLNRAKKTPPPPPPKPKKKLFQPQISQNSSPEDTPASASGSQNNVLKVTKELQQKLMFRLPDNTSLRSRGECQEETENMN